MSVHALVAVLLVYTVNQLHFPFELGIPGLNMTNLLFIVALMALLLRGSRAPRPPSRLAWPIAIYFAMLTLAMVIAMSTRPGSAMADLTYLKTAIFYPLYYLLFYHAIDDVKGARRLLFAVLVVAMVAALEAWSEARAYGIGRFVETRRAAGPFGLDYRSANRAGVYYAMMLPFFAALLVFARGRPLWRMVGFVGVVLIVGAILVTYSRQAYAIAVIAIAMVAWRRGIGTFILIAAVAAAVFPFLPQGAGERVSETRVQTTGGEARYDESTESRWELWEGAMAMWTHNPAGVGLNRFKSEIGNFSVYHGMDAHNFYVLTLAEAGPQGLFALLLLMLSIWRLGRWARRNARDSESLALAQGFGVAAVAMALGNVYGSPFHEGTVMSCMWAMAAIVERYVHLRASAPAPAPAGRPEVPLAVRPDEAPRPG